MIWCAYAWPLNDNQTGNRVFFVNQEGDLMQAQNRLAVPYSGVAGPAFSAAYTVADMSAPLANGVAGIDTQVWVPVN